jgi:hypothetical protein
MIQLSAVISPLFNLRSCPCLLGPQSPFLKASKRRRRTNHQKKEEDKITQEIQNVTDFREKILSVVLYFD